MYMSLQRAAPWITDLRLIFMQVLTWDWVWVEMFPRPHRKCVFRFSNSHVGPKFEKILSSPEPKPKYLNFFAFSFCQLGEFLVFFFSLSLLLFQDPSLSGRSQFQLYAWGQTLLLWSTLKPKSLSHMPILSLQ